MRITILVAAAFVLGAATFAAATEIARPSGTTAEILRTSKTNTGQPIEVAAAPELIVSVTTIPRSGATHVHKHRYQRYVYVLAGDLSVTNMATGEKHDYKPGDFLTEMRGTYHFGANTGDGDLKLLVIDQVPHGTKSNVTLQTEEP